MDYIYNKLKNNQDRINITFPILPLLTIAFIVLKLCKVITWSWWWVLAPTWIPAALGILIIIIVLIIWLFLVLYKCFSK